MFQLTESNNIVSKEIDFNPKQKILKPQLKKKVIYFQDR